MGSRGTHWLAALRRKRRGVLLALLPALLLWTASGSACLAMLTTGAPAVAASPHDHHTAHSGTAHGHESASPAPNHDCPHCPPHDGAATPAHSTCTDTSTAAPARVATGGSPLDTVAWLPTAQTAPLPVAASIPPLILLPRATADPPAPHVPLNIRHCVLLI